MLLILLRNSGFFTVKIVLLFTWYFHIKKMFWVWKIHFKNLCRTYVRLDLHPIGHLHRLLNKIYFKAWFQNRFALCRKTVLLIFWFILFSIASSINDFFCFRIWKNLLQRTYCRWKHNYGQYHTFTIFLVNIT